MKPESYEALYARGKARMDKGLLDSALSDVREALRLAPVHVAEVRTVLAYLRDEISNRISCHQPSNMNISKMGGHREFAISVDTLNEH